MNTKYYVFSFGKIYGPYPDKDVAKRAMNGRLRPELWDESTYKRYIRDGKVHNMR